MKNLLLLASLSVLLCFPIVLSSCGDDDDESPTYELDLFLGDWELTNSTDPEYEECAGDRPVLSITNDNLIFPAIDASGCQAGTATLDYTFNGRTFQTELFGIAVTYTIQSASETEFSWKDNFAGYVENYVKAD